LERDAEGRLFYRPKLHATEPTSTWHPPLATYGFGENSVPAGWIASTDPKSGNLFFVHLTTGRTQ